MRPLTRFHPLLPVQAMQTYSVAQPLATHWREATCKEVDCKYWQLGWVTLVDERTGLGQAQAAYIRRQSGREFREERRADGLTEFTFAAGQRCFRQHRVPLGRDTLFRKARGDWRGFLSRPIIMAGIDWLDDFVEHQFRIARKIKEG